MKNQKSDRDHEIQRLRYELHRADKKATDLAELHRLLSCAVAAQMRYAKAYIHTQTEHGLMYLNRHWSTALREQEDEIPF